MLAIPGYEDKVKGDAHVLGVDKLLGNGDGSAAAINALANEVRAKGGLFQVDHPGSKITKKFAAATPRRSPGATGSTCGRTRSRSGTRARASAPPRTTSTAGCSVAHASP
ncbi:hypothetical protein ACFQX6_05215 [Streptosporangium lutulentum]